MRLGPYEIESALGAGGMGEVYKARDTRLDRLVAIKILPAALAADPQFRERFDREARAISQLDHPHICALYDVGEQDGTACLVMQHLEGETLARRLEMWLVARGRGSTRTVHVAIPFDTTATILPPAHYNPLAVSPDGQYIVRGASWGPDGFMVFPERRNTGLSRGLPAAGTSRR